MCYNTLGDVMQSILGQIDHEFIEKKSRFIGLLYHVEDVNQVNKILNQAKDKYPGANHYVYAYIINENKQKASDDGEPSRTAGYPVLDVLNKNNLNDVLAIVIRYFGGIKLGAGGLIRAYSHTISETIKKATFIEKVTSYYCEFITDYEHLNDIERYLRANSQIDNITYLENIKFDFYVYNNQIEHVKDKLYQLNNFKDNLKVIEEKQVYAKVSH